MGIQKGIIKLDGSVDGLTFYTSNGKNLVRKSNGPTREQILYGENYARTRENISEFGACSMIAKSFRDSLGTLQNLTDGEFGNRLTKHFKFVTRPDEGARGQRPIRLSAHREEFRDFECNIHRSLSKAVAGIFTVTHNEERTRATVTMAGRQEDAIESPAGATHFQFSHVVGLVSDYIYSKAGYLPAEPARNRSGYFQYSDYLPLENLVSPEYSSTVSIPVATPLPDTISVVHAFSISFYDKVGGVYYILKQKQGHALKILEVF